MRFAHLALALLASASSPVNAAKSGCSISAILSGVPTPPGGWFIQTTPGHCVAAKEAARDSGLPALAGPARFYNSLQLMGQSPRYDPLCRGNDALVTVTWGDLRSLKMFSARPWDRPYHYRIFFSRKDLCEGVRGRAYW
jgi:ABC-type sugar transport system substrate-binding protein